MAPSLLQLPNELIGDIFEHINDRKTLKSLAQTCRRVQELAEPVLYRSILMRSSRQLYKLSGAIESRKERVEAIHAIDLRYTWQQRKWLGSTASVRVLPIQSLSNNNHMLTLGKLIGQATNMRQLTIESPYCNRSVGNESDLWRETMYKLLTNVYVYRWVHAFSRSPNPAPPPHTLFDVRDLFLVVRHTLTLLLSVSQVPG